jgi:acyl transferase domain-containing protein
VASKAGDVVADIATITYGRLLLSALLSLGFICFELRVSMKQTNLIFLFCGVGTVWTGMCRHLLQSNKVFKDTVIEIDKEIHKYTKLSMRETLEKPVNRYIQYITVRITNFLQFSYVNMSYNQHSSAYRF